MKTFKPLGEYISRQISGGSRISQTVGGRQPPRWGANLLFGQIFPTNCMKMKEISTRGHVPGAPS